MIQIVKIILTRIPTKKTFLRMIQFHKDKSYQNCRMDQKTFLCKIVKNRLPIIYNLWNKIIIKLLRISYITLKQVIGKTKISILKVKLKTKSTNKLIWDR